MAEPISVGTERISRAFMDALEFLPKVIENATKKTRNPFRTLIPTGTFELGEGLVKTQRRFHGDMGDMAGLVTWEQVQKGRAPGTLGESDPGYDPCKYNAYLVGWGFDTVGYTIYQTFRRSYDICLNDIKWNWEFAQQISLIFSFLSDVTLNVKENFNQEQYINFCRKIVWTGAADGVEFEYNPLESTELRVPVGTEISTLSSKHFRYWYEMLLLEASAGALGYSNEMPVFPFLMHPMDFDDMINNDETIRDDFRYANPTALVDNYGAIKQWRGIGFMPHMSAPRFRLNRIENGQMVFERVLPYVQEDTNVMGKRWVKNPEYVKAEYALGMYFLKDVFTTLIPPAGPASPGGGTQFGAQPSWGGEWKWLVIPHREDNPLGEKGFYFARFQMSPKPGKNYDIPVAVFYKRCPQVCLKVCTPCEEAQSGARAVVAGTIQAVDPEGTGSYTRIVLTLNAPLTVHAPNAVTVTFADTSTATAYISKDASAPTYELTFGSATDWVNYGGGIVSVSA